VLVFCHAHPHTQACLYMQYTCIHPHIRKCTWTLAYTYACACTQSHTHTHTQTAIRGYYLARSLSTSTYVCACACICCKVFNKIFIVLEYYYYMYVQKAVTRCICYFLEWDRTFMEVCVVPVKQLPHRIMSPLHFQPSLRTVTSHNNQAAPR